jgi:hypothetical protein
MNEDLKKELIQFIISEFRSIQGEMILEDAMKNSEEEKNPANIIELLTMVKKDFRDEMDFMVKFYKNEGKFEAYSKILMKIDSDYEQKIKR